MQLKPMTAPPQPSGTALRGTPALEVFDFWGALKRHRWLLSTGLVIGIALAMAYQFLTVPVYQSEMQVMVMQRNNGMLDGGGSSNPDAEGLSVAENVLASHMQLLGSRRIIKDAITNYEIGELASLKNEVKQGRDPVYYVQENLNLWVGGDGAARAANVVTATFRDPSPEDCATVLTAILSSYQEFLTGKFADTSGSALAVITDTRDRLARQLAEAEQRYIEFRRTAPLLWEGDEMTNRHKKRAAEIETELATVRERGDKARGRLSLIERELEAKGSEGLTDSERLALLSDAETDRLRLFLQISKGDVSSEEFQALQPVRAATAHTQYEQLLSLMLTERTLLADFGEEHPRVDNVREQIRVIQEYLDENRPTAALDEELEQMKPTEMLAAYVNLLRHDSNEYASRRKELEEELESELEKSRELYAYERQGMALQQEILQINRALDSVLARLGDVSIISEYGGSLPEVIAPPMPQGSPAWPKLPIVLALGTVMGLFLGSCMAVLAELSDTTFRNPDQLQAVMGTPIAAHVPYTRVRRRDKNSSIDRAVFMKHAAYSIGTESIRRIRTSLFFDARSTGSRVFAITSPTPGDGKSLLAANLALAIANAGRSVLLVDADMRRPRQHVLMGCSPDPGLSDVLQDQVEWLDAVQVSSETPHLSVLPCGVPVPNPAEILNLSTLRSFLEVASEKYDFILVDTPPLLAVSDPGIVCEHVDGVIFTTRIAKNGRDAVVSAKRILDELRARIVSVVVNSPSRREAGFGYVDRDKSAFNYGYSSDRNTAPYHRHAGAVPHVNGTVKKSPRLHANGAAAKEAELGSRG